MRIQIHGNAFVMETNPRIGKTSINLWSLILLLFLFSGCYNPPPKDKNGNLPNDTVRNFIKLVKAEDYESAQKLWYGMSKWAGVEMSDGSIKDFTTPFKDFSSRYKNIDLNKCQISKAYRGKSGFLIVDVDWEENGEKKHDSFGLKIIDGEWKMERGYYW